MKIYNHSNLMEEAKFKAKTKIRIINFIIFLTWVIAYILIIRIEKSNGDAYGFFALGLSFTIITLVSLKIVPSNRDDALRLFKFGLIGYCAYTIMFELVYWATLQGTSSNTQYVLKNFCTYGRIMIPIGLIIWQGKEIFLFFKGTRTKDEEIDYLKEHGNDGNLD